MVRRATINMVCPLIVLLMLGAQAAETWQRPRASEAEPYHQMVHEQSQQLPREFDGWVGTDTEVVEAAIQLLRPNFLYSRRYTHDVTGKSVSVLLVHCKDARDLEGHYPPRCYRNQGYELANAIPRTWEIDDVTVEAMEYHFSTRMFGRNDLIVHNFIIMPDGTFAQDMQAVESAAADYTRRFYGAGQIQIVFSDESIRADERDRITQQMIEAHMPTIEAIRTGASEL